MSSSASSDTCTLERPEKRAKVSLVDTSVDQPPPRNKLPLEKKRKRKIKQVIEPYSSEDVLYRDVFRLLCQTDKPMTTEDEWNSPLKTGAEIEITVTELSSTGDAICVLPSQQAWAVAVPFALPGEKIRARIYRHGRRVSFGDLLSIESPNLQLRDFNRVKCKYFGKCAGCQYQMLSYTEQLEIKRNVIHKAFQNFSDLSPHLIPLTLPTIPSPREYNYRTKITPHFDVPRGKKRVNESNQKEYKPRIGFGMKGRQSVLDIEECPIATPILNYSLGPVRQSVQNQFHTYKRGATLLLRDSFPSWSDPQEGITNPIELTEAFDKHVCITDPHEIVRERVDKFKFEFPAGSFFQNNNSILWPLTSYVRENILATPSTSPKPTHLVDTYCGSGLFSVSLSSHFVHVVGVEISPESIKYAKHNAELNHIPPSKCTFHLGKAEAIFDSVREFPRNQTVVIVDPPRKGCDVVFLDQLMAFGPATVVYVSCNVHTQARDIGILLKKAENKYKLESLRGFDLFPQTAHVESVAVLRIL